MKRWFKYLLALCSLLFVLSGCALPGLSSTGENAINIAGISTTESQILAYLVQDLIEHETDLEADVVINLGSSAVVHQSMLDGDTSISGGRYTGTDLSVALGREPITDPDEAMHVMQTEFDKQFNQKYYDSYGFENTYALMVSQDFAKKHQLEKVSDLKAIAREVNFGVDSSWLDRKGDGYEAFTKKYGFRFDNIYPMQPGLVYDALEQGSMDVVLGYTTDGRIASYDLEILEDDLQFFPPYDAAPVARKDLLEAHPEIDELLSRLAGTIDNEQMQKLNYKVDDELQEPATVAHEFLKANNYFRDHQKKAGE